MEWWGDLRDKSYVTLTSPAKFPRSFLRANASVKGAINVTESSACAISSPPGPENISLGEYFTLPAMGFGFGSETSDRDVGDFTYYDRYVQQVRPFVINIRGNGQVTRAKVVCVAPNQVVGGSRQPESGAGRTRVGMGVVVGVVAAVVLVW